MPDETTLSFVAEGLEMIDEVEPYLVEMGQSSSKNSPINTESTHHVFRLFHSIKPVLSPMQMTSLLKSNSSF